MRLYSPEILETSYDNIDSDVVCVDWTEAHVVPFGAAELTN